MVNVSDCPCHGVGPSSGKAGWVGGSGGWPCSTGRRVGVGGWGCGVGRSFGKKKASSAVFGQLAYMMKQQHSNILVAATRAEASALGSSVILAFRAAAPHVRCTGACIRRPRAGALPLPPPLPLCAAAAGRGGGAAGWSGRNRLARRKPPAPLGSCAPLPLAVAAAARSQLELAAHERGERRACAVRGP